MIDVQQRRAADAWFLDQGLPAVLRPGRLVRRLWPRSAPALAAFAVFMANSALVVLVTGKYTINIEGEPTRAEWFVLALLVLVLPIASLVGWLVSRISTVRGRTVAAAIAVVAAIAGGIIGGPSHLVLADLIFGEGARGLDAGRPPRRRRAPDRLRRGDFLRSRVSLHRE
ncbi:hypothetical protein [Mycobacterium sp. 2YAF39]|uniref:hypothetical protein n=1 Tax=Mycobacterium sp. 2YAF39 TaxID=3233033 RepID=UPI003F98077F